MAVRRNGTAGADAASVVEVRGRLGNQLFCWAFGQALAHRSGRPVVYLPRYRDEAEFVLPRLLETPPPLARAADTRAVGLVEGLTLTARATRVLQRSPLGRLGVVRPLALVEERDPYGYEPELLDLDRPALVRGYFQDERYSTEVADTLVAALRIPPIDLTSAGAEGPTVGMHFRRGDYLVQDLALPLAYYDRALDHLTRERPVGTLVLVGDDRDFVRLAAGHYRNRCERVIEATTLGGSALEDLATLAACGHCVISNSTFAWWAAWIGDQRGAPDRLVLAPDRWHPLGTPVPDRWTTVAAG